MESVKPITEPAPAKLNLALHVLGQRPDGYHDLDGMVAFAEIGDELTLSAARNDTFVVRGEFASGLDQNSEHDTGKSPGDDADNLVIKARDAFRATYPKAAPPCILLELTKNLPVAAGIGGGSADAAACLRLMGRAAIPAPGNGQLVALASRLGADVPMCLSSRPARISGIGARVQLLAGFPALYAVLINPGAKLLSKQVFACLTKRTNPPLPERPARFANGGELVGWLKEPPATTLRPLP